MTRRQVILIVDFQFVSRKCVVLNYVRIIRILGSIYSGRKILLIVVKQIVIQPGIPIFQQYCPLMSADQIKITTKRTVTVDKPLNTFKKNTVRGLRKHAENNQEIYFQQLIVLWIGFC